MSTATPIDISQIRINGDRLWASLMELAQIGATPKGGVCRLTLTDLDKQGRDLVTRWAMALCADRAATTACHPS
jgi:beta-ureidopropionase / N-carbamoyl-L-amino-acid hydrolase